MEYMAMNKYLGEDFTTVFSDLQAAQAYETDKGAATEIWEIVDHSVERPDGKVWFAATYPNRAPHWSASRASVCSCEEIQRANDYYIYAAIQNSYGG